MKIEEAVANFPVATWLEGRGPVRQGGRNNVYIDCPVCGGERKLGVSLDKKIAHCFRCYEGGHNDGRWNGRCGIIKLVSIVEDISTAKAIDFVYKFVGVDRPIQQAAIPERKIPDDAIELRKAANDHASKVYLDSRNLGRLGSVSHVCVSGHYAGRLILPCSWLGEVVGFEAKSYSGQTPKALYPPWFHTGDYVYTTYLQAPATFQGCETVGSLIVTESIFDAETIGINALGLYGSTLKEGQLNRLLELKHLGYTRLYWMLDWDAWAKQAKIILQQVNMFDNWVVNIPYGEDPNSLGTTKCWELLKDAQPVHDVYSLLEVATHFGRGIQDFT